KAEERPISVDEIREAYKNGTLKEAFGAGTAAVVSPISQIGFRDEMMDIPTPEDGYAAKIKKGLNAIRLGIEPDTHDWMRYVK
ncbi:MAG: branched chain amino acid aminotransferase, partial [Bacteroidota bacterium]|nr:branched chain amino acid aminotransferase [Bacteroidota bacterium]